VVGYKGEIIFDDSKPDGAPKRLLDTSKLNSLGFKPQVSLEKGIKMSYRGFLRKNKELDLERKAYG